MVTLFGEIFVVDLAEILDEDVGLLVERAVRIGASLVSERHLTMDPFKQARLLANARCELFSVEAVLEVVSHGRALETGGDVVSFGGAERSGVSLGAVLKEPKRLEFGDAARIATNVHLVRDHRYGGATGH